MKDRVKKGLELFVFFFKIGCFTFGGGWSILAQMEQEFVDKRKWLTKSELLDMVAVGRSVPGIMITNISMIFGYSVGGVFGGFCAVLGITTPAILILSIVTMFYSKLKDNVWCASALRGIRSAVVPIIASAAFSLGKEAFKTKISVAAGVIALLLCAFTNIGNIELVGLGVGSVVIWQLFSVVNKKMKKRGNIKYQAIGSTLMELYIAFMKIGFTSFGGMSMVPLILEEMRAHHWMMTEDLTNVIAIAEMTPGPLGINCATFAGERTAGVLGGIVAVTGVLMPAFTLTLLTAICFERFKNNEIFSKILLVLKPICIVLIIVTIAELLGENYFSDSRPDLLACGIGLLMLYLIGKKNWQVPKVIGLSALLGIVCYGIL